MSAFSTTNYVDFFLWIIHGANVSSNHNFYPFEVKYKSLVTYSKPFTPISVTEVDQYFTDPCTLLAGHCPVIPILDKTTGKKEVYLPPLIFSVFDDDDHRIKERIGLYHFQISKVEESQCTLVNDISTKILDHTNLISKFGSGKNITYSQLFHIVNKYCETNGISQENIVLGLISCQSKYTKYIREYDQTNALSSLVPTIVRNVQVKANILNIETLFQDEPECKTSICVIGINEVPTSWSALAELHHQGCGLNVLSYYGLIETTSAREAAVCLSVKGTSIFKIIDYINSFAIKNGATNYGYIISRMPIINGISMIIDFMQSYSPGYNYAIIFKMYKGAYQSGKDKDKLNHMGHTVSIAKDTYGNIVFIDPQSETVKIIKSPEDPVFYQYDKDTIDLIWTVKKTEDSFQENRPTATIQQLHSQLKLTSFSVLFLNRDESIHYGGKNKSKKHIKAYKTKQSKPGRKTKYLKQYTTLNNGLRLRPRKRNQSKKYGGKPPLDPFERLIVTTDENAGITSKLIID